MIAPRSCMGELLSEDNCEISLISLPHPRTQKMIKYLLKISETKCDLYEINQHNDTPSSWLMNDDSVKSDGSVLMATPFDPLFIILALLHKEKSGKFILLDQIFPNSSGLINVGSHLLKCLENKMQMNNIANVANDSDLAAYR